MTEASQVAPLITPDSPHSDHKAYDLPGGVTIRFQKGALELGRNGVTTEELLTVLTEHLQGFQKGSFACVENALAIAALITAKFWIRERARARTGQGVKGREAAHVPFKAEAEVKFCTDSLPNGPC